ncbi:DsrE family protein [Arcobacter sp. KX21116]|jgi:intracellular sulfur oxidation DsrE/DsrF family protein|uniref:DsrE family protein n=1 Tax=Arcobacter iocasae TaxID=2906515 RepID=UPI0035D480F0|tara:strand:+ start:1289 stop:1627 length:339 start_codon:yes stop_codon:yes gene_type:complete
MKIKVVFHIDEIEKWDLTLANVENLLKGIDVENSHIEIVANSKAVLAYKNDSNIGKKLEKLVSNKVDIIACNNALKNLNIEDEMLYSFVKIVPIGVKELIVRQHEGYAYLKP